MGSHDQTSPENPTPSASESSGGTGTTAKSNDDHDLAPKKDERPQQDGKDSDDSPLTANDAAGAHEDASSKVERPDGEFRSITLTWIEYERPEYPRSYSKPDRKVLKKWLFPWILCRTWKKFIVLARQAFIDFPKALDDIENENFRILSEDGKIILPAFWEHLVEPNWKLEIHFKSSKGVRTPSPPLSPQLQPWPEYQGFKYSDTQPPIRRPYFDPSPQSGPPPWYLPRPPPMRTADRPPVRSPPIEVRREVASATRYEKRLQRLRDRGARRSALSPMTTDRSRSSSRTSSTSRSSSRSRSKERATKTRAKNKERAVRSSSRSSGGSGSVSRSASTSDSPFRPSRDRKKRIVEPLSRRTRRSRSRSRSFSRSRFESRDVKRSGGASSNEKRTASGRSKKPKAMRSNYDYKFKYTVQFYRANKAFIDSKSKRKPIGFSESLNKNEKIPVLEEVLELVRSSKADDSTVVIPYSRHSYRNSEHDLALKYAIFPGDQIRSRRLYVRSPLLLNAIRAVVEFSAEAPSGNLDSMRDGVFPFPYRDLYYHKEDLLKFKESHPARARHSDEYNEECDRHIDLLIDFLYTMKEVNLKEAEEKFNMAQPITTFTAFWLLMRPGSDVYVLENGRYNAYVVDSCGGGSRYGQEHATPYVVRLWNLAFNGHAIRRNTRAVYVPVFDGDREIRSMPVFPERFYDGQMDAQPLREELIMRGKQYLELCRRPSFREYTGSGLASGKLYERSRIVVTHVDSKVPGARGYMPPGQAGELMTPRPASPDSSDSSDGPMYRVSRPGLRRSPVATSVSGARIAICQCTACRAYNVEHPVQLLLPFASYDLIDVIDTESLTDHQYLLCSSELWAFVLKDRAYDRLDVLGIREPKFNMNAIDRLVMKAEGNKSLIKAVCQSYTLADHQTKRFVADFIEGKGEGQIVLLHGPPGTGKTLTAESVAEFTKRPLLCITAADLGHDPVAVERSLQRFFRDANEWDAIVLLDEADVYLERRSGSDLRRNSIVSVFLRALDYFQGILFLTTNRVGQFDEAFMSRIHLQIGYDPLDQDAREKIWDNNFRKLEEDKENGGREIKYEWSAKEYVQNAKEVKALLWNGREIRNAFQTAVDLALYDAQGKDVPTVKESHLKKVVNMSRSFKEYMKATHEDLDDSEMAYRGGLRDDRKKQNE